MNSDSIINILTPAKLVGTNARSQYLTDYLLHAVPPELHDSLLKGNHTIDDKIIKLINIELEYDRPLAAYQLIIDNSPELKFNSLGISLQKNTEALLNQSPELLRKLKRMSNGQYVGISPNQAPAVFVEISENKEHLVIISDGLTKSIHALASFFISKFTDKSRRNTHTVDKHYFELANVLRRRWPCVSTCS